MLDEIDQIDSDVHRFASLKKRRDDNVDSLDDFVSKTCKAQRDILSLVSKSKCSMRSADARRAETRQQRKITVGRRKIKENNARKSSQRRTWLLACSEQLQVGGK